MTKIFYVGDDAWKNEDEEKLPDQIQKLGWRINVANWTYPHQWNIATMTP